LNTNTKEKVTVKPTFVFPVPSPIPAKTPREVNKISKYFKKNSSFSQKMSNANATSLSNQQNLSGSKNIIKETLKIKEIFPNLPSNKIEQVQKVISVLLNKSKPKITITTKGPSQNQVIVLMNNNVAKEFVKDSNLHVSNIN